MSHRLRSSVTSILCVLLLTTPALFCGSAEAQAGEPTAPALTVRDLPTVLPRLHSENVDEVRAAIDQLTVISDAQCVPPLAELLRSGQPDAVTDRALDALRAIGHASSIEVLTEFTHHRRAGARRRAYRALAAIEDRRIPALIEAGLRDSDREVRSSSALALGTMGSRSSLELLFRAFDRGVIEAATAIGQLGNEGSVERFDGYLGRVPLSVMLAGYDQYLRRTDINEETKLGIVTRLGEVSGRQVREFLSAYLGTFGARDRSRLRQTVMDTLTRIPIEGDTRRTAPTGAGAAAPSPGGGAAVPPAEGAAGGGT
jgi:HEAT repeat protein